MDPSLILRRVSVVPQGAFGVLIDAKTGEPFAVSLERTYDSPGGPWTKIPPGTWRCVPRWFNKGGYQTFEILIPGHSLILFHKGNVEAHSEGCVLVGERFDPFDTTFGISDGHGLTELLNRFGDMAEFQLLVDGQAGPPEPNLSVPA